MDQMIDFQINKAVFALRLIERVLHSDGQWSMRVGNLEVLAERVDPLTITAAFPAHCWIERPITVTLLHDGEPVRYRQIEPSDSGFRINWGFGILANAA